MATFDKFNACEALKYDTLEVRVTGVRQMRWRLRIAGWLIWLAAKVAGIGNIAFVETFGAPKDGG